MKVLYIVSTLQRTGPVNQIYNLIANISKVHDVTLLTLSPEPLESRWEDFALLGIKLHSLSLSRSEGMFFAKEMIFDFIKKLSPHIIHTQGFRPDTLLAKLNISIPCISTVHNIPQIDYRMTYGWFLGSIMYKKHIQALRCFDMSVGVSNAVSKNIKCNFSINKIKTIHNGIDSNLFKPDLSQREIIRGNLGLSNDTIIWIATGHLSSLKRPEDLARAFLKYSNDYENSCLIFLGDGELKTPLSGEFNDNNKIIFLGRVSNVLPYLQASDFFCSPSSSEGLPMAVIEAMGCALPVILSDIPAHLELFHANENIGISYHMGDTASLYEAMVKITSLDYSEMHHNCRATVLSYFSDDVMSAGYLNIYNSLIEDK
ncbi:glycosyltransferase family 4 protein [Aeromonas caviae]|uniref:glycosyltransferase family 4 protein n=1 Tax=Aeromonas caviae TaxID=648 RepID=UPI002B484AED|nr:glycosyltransferase family 4 protein [Aeromonas caviae]